MASPAFPGMFFAFAAAVLFLFASISPPVWDRTSFLNIHTSEGTTLFGVFGECLKGGVCSKAHVGYNLSAPGIGNVDLNTSVLKNLTYTLILHPIAGGLALIAFFFGLIGLIAASRAATVLMSLVAFFGALVGLVVFVIDMVIWNVLKNRLHNNNIDASLGNANWLTVGGVAALLLATCSAICGSFGRFATGRNAGENY